MKINGNKLKLTIFVIIAILITLIIPSSRLYLRGKVYPLVKSIERRIILNTVKNYETLEDERFIVRYEDDIEVAKLTLDISNKYYDEISSKFNYKSTKRINIIIYNDGEELLSNIKLSRDVPPLGVYYRGVINILSPREWIHNRDNFSETYEVNGPIVHELTHFIVDDVTKGNYPMWLTEGVALYVEYMLTGFEWGRNMEINEIISIYDLNYDFDNIDINKSYRRSFEVVRGIVDNWGFENLNKMLYTLGDGSTFNKSVNRVLKVNLGDIN